MFYGGYVCASVCCKLMPNLLCRIVQSSAPSYLGIPAAWEPKLLTYHKGEKPLPLHSSSPTHTHTDTHTLHTCAITHDVGSWLLTLFIGLLILFFFSLSLLLFCTCSLTLSVYQYPSQTFPNQHISEADRDDLSWSWLTFYRFYKSCVCVCVFRSWGAI